MPRKPREIPDRLTSREAAILRQELEDENDYEDEYEYADYDEPIYEGRDFNNSMVPYSNDFELTRYDNNAHAGFDMRQRQYDYDPLLGLGQAVWGYDYDNPYLTDKFGRYFNRKKPGDPNDDNYLWNPNNRETTNRIANTPINNVIYNTLGRRQDAYIERQPLTFRADAFSTSYRGSNSDDRRDLRRNIRRAAGYDASDSLPSHAFSDSGSYDSTMSSKRPPLREVGPLDLPPRHPDYHQYQDVTELKDPGDFKHYTSNLERPKVKNVDNGCIEFKSSEVIGTILSLSNPATFSLVSYSVNPGLYNFAPVLAQIGACFQYYRFTSLQFRFVSLSSSSIVDPTQSLSMGVVCMVVEDNVASKPPLNLIQMQGYAGSKSFKPVTTVTFAVDCSNPIVNNYFTRTNPTVVNGNIQLTDQFNFYLATSGFQSSYVVGELHVDYTVELCAPFLNSGITGNQNLYYRALLGTPVNGNGNFPLLRPSGGFGNMDIVLSNDGNNTLIITFPGYISTGCFFIQWVMMIQNGSDGAVWCKDGTSGAPDQNPILTPVVPQGCVQISPLTYSEASVIDNDYLEQFIATPGNYRTQTAGFQEYCMSTLGVTSTGAKNWSTPISFSTYIQIGRDSIVTPVNPAKFIFPSFSNNVQLPNMSFYGGSILIAQVNPNFAYSFRNNAAGNV